MTAFRKVRQLLVGRPFDPLDPRTRHAIAVTPLLARGGLGADGHRVHHLARLQPGDRAVSDGRRLARRDVAVRDECGDRAMLYDQPPLRGYARAARQGGRTVLGHAARSRRGDLAGQVRSVATAGRAAGRQASRREHARAAVGYRLFPGHFRNVIVLAVGEVDAKAYDGHEHLERLRHAITEARRRCRALPSQRHRGRLPDRVRHELRRRIHEPRVVDARRVSERSELREPAIFRRVNCLTAWLHNQTPVELQACLHVDGKQTVLLPMNVGQRDGQPRCTPAWTRRGKRRRRLPLGGRQGR